MVKFEAYKAGVPQGSVLAPTLFNIYISDIPSDVDGFLGQFADDTVALCSSTLTPAIIGKLQTSANKFCRYFKTWRIQVNGAKSEAILFTRKIAQRHIPTTNVVINGEIVEWKREIKYLGMMLDPRLTYKSHVDYVLTKCDKIIKSLYPLINRRSRLSVGNKLILFKSIFRPTFMYSSPVWSCCANTHLNKLQILQNKILKMMLDKPKRFPTGDLHDESEIELVKDYMGRLCTKFIQNCENNFNSDINELLH